MSATSTIAPIVKKRCWGTINAISSSSLIKKEKSGLRMLGDNSEEEELMSQEEENGEEKQKVQPLVCVIDFECGKDENKLFEEYRVGWCFSREERSYREAGTALEMLQNGKRRWRIGRSVRCMCMRTIRVALILLLF